MIYSGLAEKRVVCSEPEMCHKWCTLIEACAQSLGASDIWRGSGDLHWLCVNNCCNLHCREMSLANCSEHLTKHVCVCDWVYCVLVHVWISSRNILKATILLRVQRCLVALCTCMQPLKQFEPCFVFFTVTQAWKIGCEIIILPRSALPQSGKKGTDL